MFKSQRRWSPNEDGILRAEVELQSTGTAINLQGMNLYTNKCLVFSVQESKPINWNKVAKRIPGRSNKDCRKRFYNEVTGGLKKVGFQQSSDAQCQQFSDSTQAGPVDRGRRFKACGLGDALRHFLGSRCTGNGNTKRRTCVGPLLSPSPMRPALNVVCTRMLQKVAALP